MPTAGLSHEVAVLEWDLPLGLGEPDLLLGPRDAVILADEAARPTPRRTEGTGGGTRDAVPADEATLEPSGAIRTLLKESWLALPMAGAGG